MDLYAEHILEHYRHPQNVGLLPSASVTLEEINASCGDAITLSIKVDNDRIADIGWEGTGCAISQASMSMLSEKLAAMSVDEAKNLVPKDILALLGVPIGARRTKCVMLSLLAIQNALRKLRNEELIGWQELLTGHST